MPSGPRRTRCSFSPAIVLTGYLQISATFIATSVADGRRGALQLAEKLLAPMATVSYVACQGLPAQAARLHRRASHSASRVQPVPSCLFRNPVPRNGFGEHEDPAGGARPAGPARASAVLRLFFLLVLLRRREDVLPVRAAMPHGLAQGRSQDRATTCPSPQQLLRPHPDQPNLRPPRILPLIQEWQQQPLGARVQSLRARHLFPGSVRPGQSSEVREANGDGDGAECAEALAPHTREDLPRKRAHAVQDEG